MTTIRYLLDENMPHAVRDQLLRREPSIEILCIGDELAPPIGTLDPEILHWLEKHNYVLVSRNRRTMPKHLKEHLESGHQIPGILLQRREYGLGQLIDDLLLIWAAAEPDEYKNRIDYLPM